MEFEVLLPLEDAPAWLAGLQFSRYEDKLCITILKNSGDTYGFALVDNDALRDLLSLLKVKP